MGAGGGWGVAAMAVFNGGPGNDIKTKAAAAYKVDYKP